MIQPEPMAASEQIDCEDAPTLTADELGLVISTPTPEEALIDIEAHLREFGLRLG
jgi:hypothetical protein